MEILSFEADTAITYPMSILPFSLLIEPILNRVEMCLVNTLLPASFATNNGDLTQV